MKILVTGASGFVGHALLPYLMNHGHVITRLTRSASLNKPQSGVEGATRAPVNDIFWDPMAGKIDTEKLEGFDAVIHLAGESIVGRWTEQKKAAIRESRVRSTKLLSESIVSLQAPPKLLISASAIGYYGDRGDEILTEDSALGKTGFLPQVCREWEEAALAVQKKGIRVVNLRLGIILSSQGGALAKMITPFRRGLGGIIGSGQQYMSWIDLGDVLTAMDHILKTPSLSGPVNAVSPEPVTNKEFTKTLGSALHRPTIFPMPAVAAKLLLGEMAEELLLASARVEPKKLVRSGYRFQHPHLLECLKTILAG